MIASKDGIDVNYYFSQLTRADESRNTQFITHKHKLEMTLPFGKNLCLQSKWYRIPMLFGSISNKWHKYNGMLGRCKLLWSIEREYDIYGWKWGATLSEREAPDVEYWVEKRSTQKVMEMYRMKKEGRQIQAAVSTGIKEYPY